MKQVFQSLDTGETQLIEVPAPGALRGHLLIRTRASLVSAGTERMLLEFGRAGVIAKARQQPERVREVIEKVKTDGLSSTAAAVRSKLAQPMPLGYCNAGEVVAVGADVTGFAVGDRVASNSAHAEVVSVPANLCAKVPSDASLTDAEVAFTVLGAIALQGIRLAEPTLGERFVVTGLGLVGLLTVQLLRAQGCAVLGIDTNEDRLARARTYGAETVHAVQDVLGVASIFSRGRGVDGVLLTASTASSEPVHQAAQMSRKRGRLVMVGVTGLELSRQDFYEKELTFQVSCSYGPGRYDPLYEEKGQDYPLGFVRWTEGRNFEAVLDTMATGGLDTSGLITHRFPIERAADAYDVIGGTAPSLGVVLEYPVADAPREAALLSPEIVRPGVASATAPRVGLIGAGNYAVQTLVPALKRAGFSLEAIASSGGSSAGVSAQRFGFRRATTDVATLMAADDVDAVVIATRHNTHAELAVQAISSGKHTFVEKPVAITRDELEHLAAAYASHAAQVLTVGFNRRLSPHTQKMHSLLVATSEPKAITITVNAGHIPADHWTQDPLVGGGRLIGEACHFVDLARFLVGTSISGVTARRLGTTGDNANADSFTISLTFADGSLASINYFSNGHRAFPKERVDVFSGGKILHLDNFRRLSGFGWSGFRRFSTRTQDKGHGSLLSAFSAAVKGSAPNPTPWDEVEDVHRACFAAMDQISP